MDPLPPGVFDRLLAQVRDTQPRFWYSIFEGCIQAGFNQEQALGLVQTYILAQNPVGIVPPKANDPKKELDR